MDAKGFLTSFHSRIGGLLSKTNATIPNSQTFLAVLAFKCFDPSGAGFGKSMNRFENINRDWLRNSADIGFGLLEKNDPLQADSEWPRI